MSPSALRTLSCLTVSASDAERGVGLDVHLPGAAEAVEVVDVIAAQIHLQRVEDVGERHAHRLGLGAIDVHVELRRSGAEAVEQADEAGLLIALRGQVVGLGLQRVVVDVADRFDHQLEAAGIAQPCTAGGAEDEHAGVGNLLRNRARSLPTIASPLSSADAALVERLEGDEHRAVIRADGVQHERLAGDRQTV